MKSYRKELLFHLPTRRGLVNITQNVREAIRESQVKEGIALINVISITVKKCLALIYSRVNSHKLFLP